MITVELDMMLLRRKMKLKDLAEQVDITQANLSILKQGKAKAVRFSTLEAICKTLDCQPGDILKYSLDNSQTHDTAYSNTGRSEEIAG